MKILLDTNALLWMLSDGDQLSKLAKKTILDQNNELFFSMVSYWEICIKQSLGKLILTNKWQKVIKTEMLYNCINWLPIKPDHCSEIITLPFHHRDPFDRLLIAQAICEKLQILTRDSDIKKYNIETIW